MQNSSDFCISLTITMILWIYWKRVFIVKKLEIKLELWVLNILP